MSGAAAVLATLQAASKLKLPVHLVGVIPATENLPSGKAYKPGDILKTLSGQTVEVISTDAEGRLILSDALTYSLRYQPKAIIDLATLTGACVIALGDYVIGLFSNDESLLKRVEEASGKTGEKGWRLPLWDEYFEYLKSDAADFRNVGTRAAGAIIGAIFSEQICGENSMGPSRYCWASLYRKRKALHSERRHRGWSEIAGSIVKGLEVKNGRLQVAPSFIEGELCTGVRQAINADATDMD